MKKILKLISYLGLALTVTPSFLVFAGMLEKQTHYTVSVIGMIVWFGTAIFWIKPDAHDAS